MDRDRFETCRFPTFALRIATAFLLILATRAGAFGLGESAPAKKQSESCTPLELNFDDSADIHGIDMF
ncbi:MAG TPA: hypothetical protein VI386_02880, partial [Candidatus Sulfotelmatobacter sp.]